MDVERGNVYTMRVPWLRSVESLTPLSHEDLVRLVAQGDEAAFEELYDAVAARVFGLVRRVVRDDVWEQASRFDRDKGKAISWILVIAHRKAVDKVRASQASSDRDLRQGIKEYKESYEDVADTVEGQLEAERVQQALKSLTAAQQEAISLAYYGGYTHQEVAELLQVPVGTIKTRIRDGMIRMRSKLGVA